MLRVQPYAWSGICRVETKQSHFPGISLFFFFLIYSVFLLFIARRCERAILPGVDPAHTDARSHAYIHTHTHISSSLESCRSNSSCATLHFSFIFLIRFFFSSLLAGVFPRTLFERIFVCLFYFYYNILFPFCTSSPSLPSFTERHAQ